MTELRKQEALQPVPDTSKYTLKALVSTAYGIQQERIMASNALVALYKTLEGAESLPKREDLTDKEEDRVSLVLIKKIIVDYKAMTKDVKKLPTARSFKPSEFIKDYYIFVLTTRVINMLDDEKRIFKAIEGLLSSFTIYTHWMKGVKGLGPAISAVLLSSIDISKAKYPSSIVNLAGLGTVRNFPGDYLGEGMSKPATIPKFASGRKLTEAEFKIIGKKDVYYVMRDPDLKAGWRWVKGDEEAPECVSKGKYLGDTNNLDNFDTRFPHAEKDDYVYMTSVGTEDRGFYNVLTGEFLWAPEHEADPKDKTQVKARGRYSDHLVEREYINTEGKKMMRKDLGYNPFLKSKLYLLGASFLKANSPYRIVYDNYKERYNQKQAPAMETMEVLEVQLKTAKRAKDKDAMAEIKKDMKILSKRITTPSHIHAKCMRAMTLVFLAEFYTAYKTIEGQHAYETYSVAKLHMSKHDPIYPPGYGSE